MRIPLILFFTMSLLLTACKKKEEVPEPTPSKPIKTIPVSKEIKDWAYFNVGSYWIVRNDTTNITDSVYVSATENTTYTITPYPSDTIIHAEQIILKFQTSSFHSTYTISSYPKDNVRSHFITSHGGVMSFKILELDTIKPSSEIVENELLSNINIGGNNYSEVRYIQCYFGYSVPSSPSLFYYENNYWKKHIGLLKTKSQDAMKYGHYAPLSVIRYQVTQ